MKRSSRKRGHSGQGRSSKQRLRAKLAPEARSLRRRLAAAVAPNLSGPVLGRANIVYELAEHTRGTAYGGMGMVARLVKVLGVPEEVDVLLYLLAQHRPYHESDHVLNIAYNAPCGGKTLDLGRPRGSKPARPDDGGRLLPFSAVDPALG